LPAGAQAPRAEGPLGARAAKGAPPGARLSDLIRESVAPTPDAGGKYQGRLHVLAAPEDKETYGEFYDYGFWPGTAYLSYNNLTAGYWVYKSPNWYVWKSVREEPVTEPPVPVKPEKRSWGPEQAIGEPDTMDAGDIATAWASKEPDDQEEWLDLTYAQGVIPSAILVHETFNPGAVVKVVVRREDNSEVQVWSGRDPLEPNSGRGVAIIPFKTDFKTAKVRIYLDSKSFAGWNEIDAVGLVDEFGRTQWASGATASSTYASADGVEELPAARLRDLLIR